MSASPFTLLVCTNLRPAFDKPSCAARGSEALADALEAGITARGLPIQVVRKCCLGQCEEGPTIRFLPGGDFLLGVRGDNVADVLDYLAKACAQSRRDTRPEAEEAVPAVPGT